MNKKMLVSLLSLSLLATGCETSNSNSKEKDTRYIHSVHNNKCYELLEIFYERNSGVTVKVKEYGKLYFSAGTYIIVYDKCPICDKELSESEKQRSVK